MKLGIVSDVHADSEALGDALREMERLGCDHVVCAGDVVDWGDRPETVIEILRDRRVPTVRGNHDRWALKDGRTSEGVELTPRAMAWIERLPPSYSMRVDGLRIVVVHGRPGSDMQGLYPDDLDGATAALDRAGCDVLVVGHTHVAFSLAVDGGRRMVVNPGALLRKAPPEMGRDVVLLGGKGAIATSHGTFGVLDTNARAFEVHALPVVERGRER
jgi:putative phosphoesterase